MDDAQGIEAPPVTPTDAGAAERVFIEQSAGAVYDAAVKGGIVQVGWSSHLGWGGAVAAAIPPLVSWAADLGMPDWLSGLLLAGSMALLGLTNSMRQLQAR